VNCDYCGDIIANDPTTVAPIVTTINRDDSGVFPAGTTFNFCTVNCLRYWVEDTR
jgi:hypothetical protein